MTEGRRVGVLTDSAACLAPRPGRLAVAPLEIAIDSRPLVPTAAAGTPGAGAERTAAVLGALHAGRTVTTASPTVGSVVAALEELAAAGCTQILAVTMSGEFSATVRSVRAAATLSPVPVEVLDSRQAALALGIPVARAVAALADGAAELPAVRAALEAALAGSRTWFVVSDLEHLVRGGRLRRGAERLATALRRVPLIALEDGVLHPIGTVRSGPPATNAVITRVADAFAGAGPVDLGIMHAQQPETAAELAESLPRELATRGVRIATVRTAVLDPALLAHTGPEVLGLSVTPLAHT